MGSEYFSSLPKAVPDEVFNLIGAFAADTHPDRVNLAAGIYFTDEGLSWPLDTVRRVERDLHEADTPTRHDYLPPQGDRQFLKAARDLVVLAGNDSTDVDDLRVASVQTVSGTGANHIGARFLVDHARPRQVWLPDPTWNNHHKIWDFVGLGPRMYPYYNESNCSFDFDGMIQALENDTKPGDVLVLHGCAHNPTGLDPSKEQWTTIADLCQRKQLIPFFDVAYLGLASGDPATDAWAVHYFYKRQLSLGMIVAQSFSKNFGLYGHRTGALHIVLGEPSAEIRDVVVANLAQLLRAEVSMAPKYGSEIVKTILQNKELTADWLVDLKIMTNRLKGMRQALYDEIVRLGTPGSWEHIVDQVSMLLEAKT